MFVVCVGGGGGGGGGEGMGWGGVLRQGAGWYKLKG